MKIVELLLEVGNKPYEYSPQAYQSDLGLKSWQNKAFQAADKAVSVIEPKTTIPNKSYKFNTPSGNHYEIYFDATKYRGTKDFGINVRFFEVSPAGERRAEIINKPRDSTDAGEELRIFSTVLFAVKSYVTQHNPKFIYFSAKSDEPTRVRLYTRFANNVEKYLPNYSFVESKQSGGAQTFLFLRKDMTN